MKILEQIMCERLLNFASEFYQNPKNQEAFEKWQKEIKPSHMLKNEQRQQK